MAGVISARAISKSYGDRKAVEIRTFTEMTETAIYGEQLIRFRKRDGFQIVQPDLSVLLMTR